MADMAERLAKAHPGLKPVMYYECEEGWFDLLDALYKCLPKGTEVLQVKEKWGGLVVYVSLPEGLDTYERGEAYGALRMAEVASFRICEVCGSPGKRRSGGWIRTLCDAHHAPSNDGS